MKQPTPPNTVETEPLDFDYLERNYIKLGCKDVLIDVVEIFLETSAQKIDQIRTALETSAFEDLIKLAHGLKGESGSVGAKAVTALAAAQEQAARRGDIEEFRQRLPQLESELARAVERLKQEFSK